MTIKSLLMAGVLSLSSLTIASAKIGSVKSYDIQLTTPVKAGNVQLSAGEYKLRVEGGNAIFTDTETKKRFTAPVRIDNASRTFDVTAVDTAMQAGASHIRSIALGGSKTKLEFSE